MGIPNGNTGGMYGYYSADVQLEKYEKACHKDELGTRHFSGLAFRVKEFRV